MSSRAFTAVGLPIMGGNSTPEELFNLNDLRVELLQSVSRDLLFLEASKSRFLSRHGGIGMTVHWWTRSNQFPHLPTTRMTNEPGFTLGQRSPGAGGPRSAAERKTLCVFKSSAIVRALFFVGTLSTTVNLSGESS